MKLKWGSGRKTIQAQERHMLIEWGSTINAEHRKLIQNKGWYQGKIFMKRIAAHRTWQRFWVGPGLWRGLEPEPTVQPNGRRPGRLVELYDPFRTPRWRRFGQPDQRWDFPASQSNAGEFGRSQWDGSWAGFQAELSRLEFPAHEISWRST